MDRNILLGRWFKVETEKQFNNLVTGGSLEVRDSSYSVRCQRGDYVGPGKYLFLNYSVPCPRGCCTDSVHEVISENDVITECKDVIKEYVALIKSARPA